MAASANKDAAHQTPLKPAPVSKKATLPGCSSYRNFQFFPAFSGLLPGIFSMIVIGAAHCSWCFALEHKNLTGFRCDGSGHKPAGRVVYEF